MGRRQDRVSRGKGRTGQGKATLPEKICVACGRPFQWRKKWERCWEQVRYCSDRCRMSR